MEIKGTEEIGGGVRWGNSTLKSLRSLSSSWQVSDVDRIAPQMIDEGDSNTACECAKARLHSTSGRAICTSQSSRLKAKKRRRGGGYFASVRPTGKDKKGRPQHGKDGVFGIRQKRPISKSGAD